jgi:PAS domain S-box-containing protein
MDDMSTPIRIVALLIEQDSVDSALRALARAGFAPDCDTVASEHGFAGSLDPAPDLVLCESQGSGLSAERVLALVREHGLNVPVIVGSDRPEVEEAVALMKQGAADYLDKAQWERLGQAAREALQRSQGSHLDRVPHGIIEFDSGGVITFCNQAFANMTGYSKQDIIGMRASGLASTEEEAARLTEALGSPTDEQPVPAPLVTSTRHKDGHVMDCLVDWDHVRDMRGRVTGGIAAVTDITERRRAEDALRRSEAQFRGMMESMPALVSIFNKERRLYTNAARAAFAECDEDEIQQLGAFDLVHPDYLPAVEEYAQACFEGRETSEPLELKVNVKSGVTKWARISGCLIEYEGGPAILSVGVDITKAKRAEQALRRREKQLRTIIEHIPVMVDALDEDGTLILWNHECERVTGYTAAEIVGNPRALDLLYPDDAYRERKLEEWRDRGNAYRDWPWTLTCKDGTRRTVSWSNVSDDFPVPGWAAWKTGIDVTEQRQLERQIIDIGAREKRRIGRNLHDRLGQHLTGIGFKSELLARDLAKRGLPETAAAEEIQVLVSEAIEQTRNLARGLSPVRRSADGLMLALQGLSARVTDMFGVPSSFVCEEPAFVHDKAAASHLYWIAHEAVTNAIKHASPGHIEVVLSSNNGGVTLTVEDDGDGFPETARDGRGMGLQIMEYRARMIEGLLGIGPRPGGGTRVTCVFKEGTATQP